jgi:hypothetical protein
MRSQDSSVSIVTRLLGWLTRIRFLAAQLRGPHSLLSSGALSLMAKQLAHEADHSPPSSGAEVNVWSYTSTPSVCVHGVVHN